MTLLSGLVETFCVLMRNNIRTSFYSITKFDSGIYIPRVLKSFDLVYQDHGQISDSFSLLVLRGKEQVTKIQLSVLLFL